MKGFPLPHRSPASMSCSHPCRLLLALSLGISALGGCVPSADQGGAGKAERPVATIRGETLEVTAKTWPTLVRTQGSLMADEVTSVAAKVPGRVAEVLVDLGDFVEQGKLLVRIEEEQYELLVTQAESQLTQARSAVGLREGEPLEKLNPENAAPVREAKAVYDEAQLAVQRLRTLSAKNAISANELEVAESVEKVAAARLTSAQNSVREKIALIHVQTAQLGLARQNLIDTKVLAPFDGVIQAKNTAVGSYVQPGQSLYSLVRLSPIRFRGAVPERYAHHLQLGQEVRLHLDLSGQRRTVRISRISPTVDPASRSLTFEALIENEDHQLRAGLFAEAEVVLDPQATAIVIPTQSLIRFAGVDKVWKIEGESIREQVVRLGRRDGDLYEIVHGLNEGDVILANALEGKVGRFEAPSLAPSSSSTKEADSSAKTASKTQAARQADD